MAALLLAVQPSFADTALIGTAIADAPIFDAHMLCKEPACSPHPPDTVKE